jgi:hypothetical protein
MTRIYIRSVFLAVVFLFGNEAQAQNRIEYRLKAVYLLNFLQFVEWPTSAFEDVSSPIILGVYGDDPFGSLLDEAVSSETADGRPIIVRRFSALDSLDHCHALFVSNSERNRLAAIFDRLSGSSVLTVSDIDGFEDAGGGIGFFLDRNKIRFAINLQSVKLAKLQVRSKLLRLAKVIDPS